MGAKKAKTPPRAIRYLLSADRRLQRLSLKKMSGGEKKARGPRRRNRVKSPDGTRPPARFGWATSAPAIAVAVIGIVGTAALLAAVPRFQSRDVAGVDAPSDVAAAPAMAPATSPPASKTPATKAAAPRPVTAGTARANVATSKPATAPPATSVEKTLDVTEKTAAVDSTGKNAPVESDTPADTTTATVTIVGCLERHDDSFQLKDTSGANAPKRRGWRSAFLKKRPAPIELVDPRNTLKLSNYVGQRVAVTGILADREMRTRSVGRVAASCN